MICAGIDAGSRTLKIVLLDAATLAPLADGVRDQGIDQDRLAADLLGRLLKDNGLSRQDLTAVIATGYGRKLLTLADSTVTEITCQAWGVRHCARRPGRSSTSAARTAKWSSSARTAPWPTS